MNKLKLLYRKLVLKWLLWRKRLIPYKEAMAILDEATGATKDYHSHDGAVLTNWKTKQERYEAYQLAQLHICICTGEVNLYTISDKQDKVIRFTNKFKTLYDYYIKKQELLDFIASQQALARVVQDLFDIEATTTNPTEKAILRRSLSDLQHKCVLYFAPTMTHEELQAEFEADMAQFHDDLNAENEECLKIQKTTKK